MIQDFQSAKRIHQLAKSMGMTDSEIAEIVRDNWDSAGAYVKEHFDKPLDAELPDGTHARSRDEWEEWHAKRGERI